MSFLFSFFPFRLKSSLMPIVHKKKSPAAIPFITSILDKTGFDNYILTAIFSRNISAITIAGVLCTGLYRRRTGFIVIIFIVKYAQIEFFVD